MNLDIERLLNDHSIPYITSGDRHCSKGWLTLRCPFCGDGKKWHLGYNLANNFFSCYSCGWHPVEKTLKEFLGVTSYELTSLLTNYLGSRTNIRPFLRAKTPNPTLSLPYGFDRLKSPHKTYLEKRNFDPDKLERKYNLKGTGPVCKIIKGKMIWDYKLRIIAPIYYGNALVSFQGRDITEKQEQKYKACPKELEVREHKHCLYGLDNCTGNTVIVVEGVFDKWRMGEKNVVATFGTEYLLPQILLLAKSFKRIFFIFDSEPAALKQAEKGCRLVSGLGAEAYKVELDKPEVDPGDLPQDEADTIYRDLMKEVF